MITVGLFAIACGEMKIGIAKDSHPNFFIETEASIIYIYIYTYITYIYIDR